MNNAISSTPLYTTADKLAVEIYPSCSAAECAAAASVASHLATVIGERGTARLGIAYDVSQDKFLEALGRSALAWERVTVFQLNESIGSPLGHEFSIRARLIKHFIGRVRVDSIVSVADERTLVDDAEQLIASQLTNPLDLVCLGIGNDGDVGFNQPRGSQFEDPVSARAVPLTPHAVLSTFGRDGPVEQGVTATLPVFRRARKLSILVPSRRKSGPVFEMLERSITTKCPASILRTHPSAVLYLDEDSASVAYRYD